MYDWFSGPQAEWMSIRILSCVTDVPNAGKLSVKKANRKMCDELLKHKQQNVS